MRRPRTSANALSRGFTLTLTTSVRAPGDNRESLRSRGAHVDSAPSSAPWAAWGLSHVAYLADSSDGTGWGVGFSNEDRVRSAADEHVGRFLKGPDYRRPDTPGPRRRYSFRIGPGAVRVAGRISWPEGAPAPGGKRGRITEWSQASRMRMVETMASLDWAPVLDSPVKGHRPGMITLTVPGQWLDLCPDGAAFKAAVDRFRKRMEREFYTCGTGHDGSCSEDCGAPNGGRVPWVWKEEFQRRGAPHLHVYTACGVGIGFQRWLALAWTNSLFTTRASMRDGEVWQDFIIRCHEQYGLRWVQSLQAGTSVDWAEGIRASDPKRLAIYFLKRAAGHNASKDKEYQNRVPFEWGGIDYDTGEIGEADNGPGRFWGYRGLQRATAYVELTEDEFVQVRRLMRRWSRANGRDLPWLGRSRMSGGMLLVNDAPDWFRQAARWLAMVCQTDTHARWDDLAVAIAEVQAVDLPAASRRRRAPTIRQHGALSCRWSCTKHLPVRSPAAFYRNPWASVRPGVALAGIVLDCEPGPATSIR